MKTKLLCPQHPGPSRMCDLAPCDDCDRQRGRILLLWIYVIIVFSGLMLAICCPARGQTMCQNLGGGMTSCTNGTSSQRLGDFDFNSDGSWGMRLGGGMYLANPPANPQADAPQYPPNDTYRPYEPTWPGKRPTYR